MKDKIVHPKTRRPIIQNLHPEYLSHIEKQHDNLVTRFLTYLGYFDDMNSIVTITQTQIFNPLIFNSFICNFSFKEKFEIIFDHWS